MATHPCARLGLDDVRLLDLHSFASVAAAGGHSLPTIGALLGHTQPATTQRYAQLSGNRSRAASESVAARIHAVLRNDKGPTSVAPLETTRALA